MSLIAPISCAPIENRPLVSNNSNREIGRRVSFAFGTPRGTVLTDRTLYGRVTAILFVTTFDLTSQALARNLNELLREHRPRINGVAVVLEPPKYAVLAESFAEALELSYPVALADPSAISEGSAFGRINIVPTLVVLDARSRLVSKVTGVVSKRDFVRLLREAES